MKKSLFAASLMLATALGATAAQAQGWTFSLLGGGTMSPHLSIGAGSDKISNRGFNSGGRIGYDVSGWMGMSGWSLDLDTFYTQADYNSTLSRRSSLSMMGDLIYHAHFGLPFGVYAGGGAGAVRTMLSNAVVDGGSTVFGWQAIGGIDMRVAPEATLFAEYRYQNAHDVNIGPYTRVGDTTNNISVGFKFAI